MQPKVSSLSPLSALVGSRRTAITRMPNLFMYRLGLGCVRERVREKGVHTKRVKVRGRLREG